MFKISGKELYSWHQQAIKQAIADNISSVELNWLLQEIAGLDSLSLRLHSYQTRKEIELTKSFTELQQLWQHRIQERWPIQYILGITYWRNFRLKVTPDVLIPRPETECLIDIIINLVSENPTLNEGNWVDLGTGSGAIALSLAQVLTNATIYATDFSSSALAIAEENAQSLNLAERIRFYQGVWWQAIAFLQGKVRGMVSNPPYIPTSLVSQLQPEVTKHEPHLALDGGEDGLEQIRYLVATAPNYLVSGGIWLIEMMAGQTNTVVTLLKEEGKYRDIQIFTDLAGIERFVLAYLKS